MDGGQKNEVPLMDGLPGTFARQVPGYSELCVFYQRNVMLLLASDLTLKSFQ